MRKGRGGSGLLEVSRFELDVSCVTLRLLSIWLKVEVLPHVWQQVVFAVGVSVGAESSRSSRVDFPFVSSRV